MTSAAPAPGQINPMGLTIYHPGNFFENTKTLPHRIVTFV